MSGSKKRAGKNVIIRKEEIVEGGHHGGAWKVAYADFVTAMMAFFLLMWLLNATTAEKRQGIADYFSPTNLMARTTSGSGAPFGGRTPNSDGEQVSDQGLIQPVDSARVPILDMDDNDGNNKPTPKSGPAPEGQNGTEEKPPVAPAKTDLDTQTASTVPNPAKADGKLDAAQVEKAAFERAAEQLRKSVANDPALADVARQLTVDITPDGLRIQLVDEDKQPMFATGSAALNDRAKLALLTIAPVLTRLPEPVAISGHTDATPFRSGDRTNWDLSADRANATRRLLTDAGLPEARLRSVTGTADRDPLLPGDPFAAANRRIAITVLRSAGPHSVGVR